MSYYKWEAKKNDQLKSDHGISFEQIILHIERGDLHDIVFHPGQTKYLNQQILVVQIHDYVYLVPFTENENGRFLKTIIPSRKATQTYLGQQNEWLKTE